MYSDHQLRIMFGAGSLAVVAAILGGLAYLNKPLPPDGEAILGSPQLVLFETDRCGWCDDFRRTSAREYRSTQSAERAPLSFISVEDSPPPKRYRLDGFTKTPMLVIFDQYGRELARVENASQTSAELETLVRKGLRRVGKG